MGADQLSKLTESHRAYLRLVLAHKSSKEIAQHFGISAHTVDKRLKEAMKILGVATRVDAALILDRALNEPQRLGPQSPDLANLPISGRLSPSITRDDGRGMMTGSTLREDQMAFQTGYTARSSFPLPFPTQGKSRNDLTILQRVGWTFALIIGLAIATGILLSGLTNLSTLLTELRR